MSREFEIVHQIRSLVGTLVERGWSAEEEGEFHALSRERVHLMRPRLPNPRGSI